MPRAVKPPDSWKVALAAAKAIGEGLNPNFEALRNKRNQAIEALAEKYGIHHVIFNPNACYCACPDGPCEHKWNGPDYISQDQTLTSVTCSRCGAIAAYHDMRVGP